MKFQILKHFSFLFRITRERVGIKLNKTESTVVIGPGKYIVCRRVRELFCPDILQALAVKGLNIFRSVSLFFNSGSKSDFSHDTTTDIWAHVHEGQIAPLIASVS